MIYRVWRIRNQITGRYLAAQGGNGAVGYLVFLTKQSARQYAAVKGLSAAIFRPCEMYRSFGGEDDEE